MENIKKENRGGRRKYSFPKIGDKFDYWTVITEKPIFDRKQWKVLCQCKCGKQEYVRVNALQSGKSKGCKCRAFDMRRKQTISEGELSKTKFNRIKKSANERGIEFLVTMKYLWELFEKQNKKCVFSGLDLILSKDNLNTTASLDRIDSNEGYTENNVQWVHKDVNKMKTDFSDKYFISMCHLISNNTKINNHE